MKRITTPSEAVVAAYVWDYAGGVEMGPPLLGRRGGAEPEGRAPRPGRAPSAVPPRAVAGPLLAHRARRRVRARDRGADGVHQLRRLLDAIPRRGGSAPAYLASLPADARTRICGTVARTTGGLRMPHCQGEGEGVGGAGYEPAARDPLKSVGPDADPRDQSLSTGGTPAGPSQAFA
ncbi:MAG: hypothetical protein MZV65_18630 [Chromatiales bacterium]|nr:hypothetical protein [Chromatiales bacterium]